MTPEDRIVATIRTSKNIPAMTDEEARLVARIAVAAVAMQFSLIPLTMASRLPQSSEVTIPKTAPKN